MYNKKTFIAVIPARGGSKGIKDKNIIDLCGKPLIAYSIEAARKSKYIDEVVVSTDSEKIAETAERYGAEVPFLRPQELASDQSKTIDAVMHCIHFMKEQGKQFDYIVLLQPTQPLRIPVHIDEAIEKLIQEEGESLVSISKVKEHPILMRQIEMQDQLVNLLNVSSTQRRQDFKPIYKVNGSIYINKISKLTLETSLNDNSSYYLMDEKYDVDIDEPIDLEIAKLKLNHLLMKNER